METDKQFLDGRALSRVRVLAASGVLAALAAGAAGQAALAQSGDVSAAWQRHKTTFNYIGISPTYSCEGLTDALSYLLEESGAQLNRAVMAYPCSGGGPTPLTSANLDFSTLQAAPGASEDAAAPVTGVWRHVEFSLTRSNPQLHGSDCELVQEFRDKVLPMFTTRNVTSRLFCVAHQSIGNQFDLSFEVLAPANAPRHHATD